MPLRPIRATPPISLPVPLTPFIGRTHEVVKVRSYLLSADVRLLNLTGGPGIGETRRQDQHMQQFLFPNSLGFGGVRL